MAIAAAAAAITVQESVAAALVALQGAEEWGTHHRHGPLLGIE